MCLSCFKEYTVDPVVNERVVAAADLIAASPEADFSTLLHIMVSDMNVDDHWFDLDREGLRERYDAADGWERSIFDALSGLTEAERATAVAMEWGYFDREGNRVEP
jgi:hypothetical protein